MVAENKQKILTKLQTVLGRRVPAKFPKDLSVLDHVLIAVLQENASPSLALERYQSMLGGFHDFNELRVSHPRELLEYFGDLPEAQEKARRVLSVLQFVFETTYDFDLESMRKKPLKQAVRQLSKIIGVTPFVVAATIQRALGGHVIPLDDRMLELLKQIDLLEAGESPDSLRELLEDLVPKSKGLQFSTSLAETASDDALRDEAIESIAPQAKKAVRRKSSARSPVPAIEAAQSPSTNGSSRRKPSPRSR